MRHPDLLDAVDTFLASAPDVPDLCQQFGCREPVQTWCPLCRAFFCAKHDQLTPRRMHDCLRGRAEAGMTP